ncbi:hypothetical protein OAG68_00435 [bacterium]|nr:hypothetical protein [bacterium]
MQYQTALRNLTGRPLQKIGRAADLLWLQFGELHEVSSNRGMRTVGDWAVHVQTSWRFVQDAKIIVAVGDLYMLPDGSNYDWDAGGISSFDSLAKEMNRLFAAGTTEVLNVVSDDVGGFSIKFSGDIRFDLFTNTSDSIIDIEHWRIFQPTTDDAHLVRYSGDNRNNT